MISMHRPIVISDNGIVVSGHHRASEAGAAVLRNGGNAMDAAITAAAVLTVAIPNMNGIGGDAIALYYDARAKRTSAINGSGRSPAAATVELFRSRGFTEIPRLGPLSMSVCGIVHAWEMCLKTYGTISFAEALAPAIELADDGVPVDTVGQTFFAGEAYHDLARDYPELATVYGVPGERRLGERLRQPKLAASLRELATDGSKTLYGGALCRALLKDLQQAGSLLTLEDFTNHETLIRSSISVGCGRFKLHAAPPNSQGLALIYLAGLWEAEKAENGKVPGPSVADYLRLKEIAFTQRDAHAADPDRTMFRHEHLDPAHLAMILAEATTRRTEARAGGGDTSTLVVIDKWGNAVSWVQSLFEDFGSGIISPSTGIVMHNRLYLEEVSEHPVKGLRPSTRPFHTLCPALLIGDECELAIATPGDHGQPQAIFQVIMNMYERGMNIQQAIEAPRLRHDQGPEVMLEDRAPDSWREAVEASGFAVRPVGRWSRLMGGVNAIRRDVDGLLFAGADPRRACYAVAA